MKAILLLIALFLAQLTYANTDWMRYASISPDGKQIVFTYKGDLYLVPANGGDAKPLTFHTAHDYEAVWSHDGTKICFASNRYGNFDLFVIDAKGGQAKRLTYHSADEIPYTFSSDDKYILFGAQRLDAASHRQYPTKSQPELYKVAAAGSNVKQVWTIPAQDVQVNKNGNVFLYHDKKGGEDKFRKHHVSSITRDIWKYDAATKKHTKLTTFRGEDRNPAFAPNEEKFYFLSERNGAFNVHSMSLKNASEVKQVTNFKPHPVRYLSISKNGTLCFTYNGSVYTKKGDAAPEKININIRTEAKENPLQLVKVQGNISEMAVSPNGKEVAYIVRGEIFVSSVKGNMHKRITETPARERFVSFSPDGKHIIFSSERDAKWSIYRVSKVDKEEPYFFASTLLKEEPLIENENNNYQPKYSPDGEKIAFIEKRRTLKIFNLKDKTTKTLLGKDKLFYMSEGDQYFTWSPDSKWLLAEYSPVLANTEVLLVSTEHTDSIVNLTQSGYGDYHPKWVNGGKQILWFSDRHGLRSYANSGSRQKDAYAMFLTKESWERFNLSKDEYALLKEVEKKEKKKEDEEKDKKRKKKKDKDEKVDSLTVKFDWDGLRDRKKRLTIHSSKLGDAVLSKDGQKLYYLARFEKNMNLWQTNLRTKETKMLINLGVKSGSLQWDKKMKTLFLLADGKVYTINPKEKKKKKVSLGGEMMLDVVAERQQMFDHVWERNKGMFYISGYHGADWEMLRKNYEPKLKSIGNDFEFVELLSEMLGELNVSHSGARYRHKAPDRDKTAALGIFMDYEFDGPGIKIAEIIKGGPLDKSHLDVTAGTIITKIDGKPISQNTDNAGLLNRKAGKYTALTILNAATGKEKNITVKPISRSKEKQLMYKRWVRKNEEEVAKLSNGKLAYVHIPGMSDGPYRNTYEKVMGKYYECDGLIVDTRFNGGGDLVGDLSMFLTGENFMQYAIEDRTVGYEPAFRWTKPSVAMVNEANYSDGHCFSCMYQDLNIGKLIGMPVPGTCSFAGWEMLQNGKVLWGSIPVSAKNKAGEWLENNETVPDVQVKNMPETISKGEDQQLERAVKELLKVTD